MKPYDFVIIGSGLGGLECGYILAKEGYRVCVLEKNRQFGGNLQTFVRDRIIFDTGVHYIGGLEEGQNLHQYFKYFGLMDKLRLQRMDLDAFDVVTFADDPNDYPYAQGYERFVHNLSDFFPDERRAIQAYADKLREVADDFPLYSLRPPTGRSLSDSPHLKISARDYINSLTDNPKLQQVLAGTNPLYAGDGDRTPIYVHALVVNSYVMSAWKCVDGGSQISRLLVRAIKDMGGEVLKYHEVCKLPCGSDGAISRAVMTDGQEILGKAFISNIHPAHTLQMLQDSSMRKVTRRRIQGLDNSISAFTVHIVLKPDSMPYENRNYYHFEGADVWKATAYDGAKWPEGYALFFPAHSGGEDYANSLNLLSYMRFDEMAAWAGTRSTIPRQVVDRGDGYEAFKQERAEKLIDLLSKKYPDLRSHMTSYYTSTPITYRDYIGAPDGSMYGIVKDYNNPLRSFIAVKSKVPNLYFTGQNLNMHGVLGVTVSSVSTCSEILGCEYLIKKILEA